VYKKNAFSWLSLRSGIRDDRHYLETLDVLRGWAILLVFLFHAWGISGGVGSAASGSLWFSYIEAGRTGVTLFFVLSGFLLSLPWWFARQDSLPSLKNYYLARLLRIIPLYYFAVLIACLSSGEWNVGLRALAFQFVAFEIFPFSVVWWTLATEMQFYLVLPLLMWLLVGGRFHRFLLLVILLVWGWFYVTEVLANPDGARLRSYFLTKSLFGRLPAFLLGIFAAWLYLRLRSAKFFLSRPGQAAGVGLLLLSLMLLAAVLQRTVSLGEWESESGWHIHHVYEAGLWAAVLLLLLLLRRPATRTRPGLAMAYLGKLSYSLYMWHVPVLFYLIYPTKERLSEAYLTSIWFYGLPVLAFVISVVLAMASYRWIELPALNIKRTLTVRPRA